MTSLISRVRQCGMSVICEILSPKRKTTQKTSCRDQGLMKWVKLWLLCDFGQLNCSVTPFLHLLKNKQKPRCSLWVTGVSMREFTSFSAGCHSESVQGGVFAAAAAARSRLQGAEFSNMKRSQVPWVRSHRSSELSSENYSCCWECQQSRAGDLDAGEASVYFWKDLILEPMSWASNLPPRSGIASVCHHTWFKRQEEGR